MVLHRLDSLSDFARKDYDVRIVCRGCGHAVIRDPAALLLAIAGAGGSQDTGELGARLRCSACGHRGAKILPTARQ